MDKLVTFSGSKAGIKQKKKRCMQHSASVILTMAEFSKMCWEE